VFAVIFSYNLFFQLLNKFFNLNRDVLNTKNDITDSNLIFKNIYLYSSINKKNFKENCIFIYVFSTNFFFSNLTFFYFILKNSQFSNIFLRNNLNSYQNLVKNYLCAFKLANNNTTLNSEDFGVKFFDKNRVFFNYFSNLKTLSFNINFKINLISLYKIKFSVSDFFKNLNNLTLNQMNILFLRKNKVFNKGRYSRNRQYYRTGVY
jgi:hypothetical protein